MPTYRKTSQYIYLEKRINQIKKNFNFTQSINGITQLQSDRLRGFRLLCHAEFEDYFESIAIKLLEESESKWKNKKVANYNLASLFISYPKIENQKKLSTCETRVNKIIADFRQKIKDNHGIKEDNIKNLFEPLGYGIDDFDATFINTLSSFGALRGETAHTSAKRTQQPLDKNTEMNRINNLLLGIVDFEKAINQRK